MGNRLFLHVGYPKTGTTSLQRHFFPAMRQSDLSYVGSGDPQSHHIAIGFGRAIHGDTDAVPAGELPAGNCLISCERITADCFRYLDSNGGFSPLPVAGIAGKCLHTAQAHGYDDVRVILVLRRQGELSHSLYAQSYAHYFNHAPDLDDYACYAEKIIAGGRIAAAYDFSAVVESFFEIFGRKNVLVLFFEDLAARQTAFLETLAGFIGCARPHVIAPENVRRTAGGRRSQSTSLFDELSMIKRKLLPGVNIRAGRVIRLMQHIPIRGSRIIEARPELEQEVTAAYYESNSRLGRLLNRDLSALGYY